MAYVFITSVTLSGRVLPTTRVHPNALARQVHGARGLGWGYAALVNITSTFLVTACEVEGTITRNAVADNRGTPIFFDVCNDAVETCEMIARVAMKRISQVAAKHDISSHVDHLPDAKGAP